MAFTSSSQASSDDPLVAILHAFSCGFILLRDSLAVSGHFLLPWLTSASLAQGHKVVFIAAAYSPAKHKAALKKIGAPGISTATLPGQSSSSNSGAIAFVTPTAAPHQQQQQQQHDGQESSSSASRMQHVYHRVEEAARQLLQQQQHQDPQQQQQQQGLTVVLDSFAVLSSLVCDEQQTAALLHQLTALGEVLQVPYRLIVLASRDVAADSQQVAAAAARANVIADLSPLEGRTAALDGSLTVTVRRACRQCAAQQQQQQQQHDLAGHQQQLGGITQSWLNPGSSSVWFFRAGDVAVRWLPEVHGKELIV